MLEILSVKLDILPNFVHFYFGTALFDATNFLPKKVELGKLFGQEAGMLKMRVRKG